MDHSIVTGVSLCRFQDNIETCKSFLRSAIDKSERYPVLQWNEPYMFVGLLVDVLKQKLLTDSDDHLSLRSNLSEIRFTSYERNVAKMRYIGSFVVVENCRSISIRITVMFSKSSLYRVRLY